MAQHHTPNHYSIAIVFFVALLAIGFILLWALYLNIGTLQVRGEYPFKVTLNGDDIFCESLEDCIFDIAPRDYKLKVSKEGYYDFRETVVVHRGDLTDFRPQLKVVPFLRDFIGEIGGGKYADGRWGGNVDRFVWHGDDAFYFQGKGLYAFEKGVSSLLVQFQLLDLPYLAWNGGDYVAVSDSGRLTLVDIVGKRKQRVFDNSFEVIDMVWNFDGTQLLLDGKRGDSSVLVVYHTLKEEMYDFVWYDSFDYFAWSRDDRNSLLFVSDKEFSYDVPGSFKEVLDRAGFSLVGGLKLYGIDLLSGEMKVVYDLEDAVSDVKRLFWWDKSLLIESNAGMKEIVL